MTSRLPKMGFGFAFGGRERGPLVGTFRQQYDLVTGAGNPRTQAGGNFGGENINRHALVMWYAASASATCDSMTIGGVQAVPLVQGGLTAVHGGIFMCKLPTNTNTDIVATYGGSPNNIMSFMTYDIVGAADIDVPDTANITAASGITTKTFACSPDGFVAAFLGYQNASVQTPTGDLFANGTRASSPNRLWFGSLDPTGITAAITTPSFSGNRFLCGVSLTPRP